MVLPGIDRELDFYELAVMTRSTQSRMYSRPEKGILSQVLMPISQYMISCLNNDPSTEYEKVKKAFSGAAYTLKDGEIVVKDGEIEATPKGKIYWVNAKVPSTIDSAMQKDIDVKFRKYYTVSKANYMVEDAYLQKPVEIATEGVF